MIEEQTTPRTDFYLKLASEAEMPTALAAFYKQDYTTIVDPETDEESTQVEGDPLPSADYGRLCHRRCRCHPQADRCYPHR